MMAISTRAGLTLGLAALGVAVAVGVSHGQADPAVRKTASGASGAADKPAVVKLMPAVVGTIDVMSVFQNYEKTKFQMEQFKAEAMAKRAQLSAIAAEGKQIVKEMESFEQGSKDFKDRASKFTEIKAKLEATKQNAEMDGQVKQVEIMAVFHKEMKAMTEAVARMKGVTTVVAISSAPLNTQDPDSVMAAMSFPIVWADPNTDLTRHVLHNLNNRYIEAGNPVAKNTAPVGTADEAPATAPAARPAAAPGNANTRSAPSTGRGAAPAGRPAAPTGDK